MQLGNSVKFADILCGGILAFFAMQGAIPGISPNQASEMTSTAATGLMKVAGIGSQIVIDGTIVFFALRYWRRLNRFAFSLQWTAAVAGLALVSVLWSQDALMTARRAIPFVLATLFGLYFATQFSVRRQLTIFCTTMLVAAIASTVLALFVPSVGLEASIGHFGNWQGIFTQKNACGRAMVFASAAVFASGRLNLYRLACLMLFLFVMVMSGTRGAWVIEIVLLCFYALIRLLDVLVFSARMALIYAAVVLALIFATLLWVYFPFFAALLGRDATLTGRTAIWNQVWIAILKHPFLGYGFAAFWRGMKGESYNVIVALKFVLFHAHNGFLEIWLELGAAGLLLFALSYLHAWRKLWPLILRREIPDVSWMAFVLMLILLYNLDENTLLTFNGLFWIIYVSVIANIEILAVEHRAQQQLWAIQEQRHAWALSRSA